MSVQDLALYGGAPVAKDVPRIGYGASLYDETEEKYLLEAIRSKRLMRHQAHPEKSFCYRLERHLESYLGVRHVYATPSASVALVGSLLALGVGPGDEVILPATTWVTCLHAILATGAKPVVAQVDETYTIDVSDVKRLMNERTAAIMPAHIHGFIADIQGLLEITKGTRVKIVEDNAQCPGGTLNGKMAGTIGDVGCFSFNFAKLMSAGDGGFIATNRDDIYEFFIHWADTMAAPVGKGHLNFSRLVPGITQRMTELTGAVALAQAERLPSVLRSLRQARDTIKSKLAPSTYSLARCHDFEGTTGVSIALKFDDAKTRQWFEKALRAEGVWMTMSSDTHLSGAAEYVATQEVLPRETPIFKQRPVIARHWECLQKQIPIHPKLNPWNKKEDYSSVSAPSEAILDKLILLRLNPMMKEAHALAIAEAVNKVDSALRKNPNLPSHETAA